MAAYRVYTAGKFDRLIGVQNVEADTDEEAIERAKLMLDGHDLEVWTGDRQVGIVPAKPISVIRGDHS